MRTLHLAAALQTLSILAYLSMRRSTLLDYLDLGHVPSMVGTDPSAILVAG